MKKGFFALLACVLLVSCAKLPETEKTYTLTVTADKGAGSKALSIEGGALKATWEIGETVTVYKGGGGMTALGTLTAQSKGKKTRLSGTISGSLKVDDDLVLDFLSSNYTSQDGTLSGNTTSIDKTCDYATAVVKITGINGNTITTEDATFKNRQAIVKFTLKLKDNDSPLVVSEMSIQVTGQKQNITILVRPPSATSELYVAIPCYEDPPFSLFVDAVYGSNHYRKNIESQELVNGYYYHYTLSFTENEVYKYE